MSLCDRCYAPGHCCKDFALNESTVWTDQDHNAFVKEHELPFRVSRIVSEHTDDAGRPYAEVRYSCPALLPTGRCGIYDTRPLACRLYQPLDDGLCVHFGGAETGERT